MPLYEYECKACGHHFDTLRSMKDADAPVNCRKCESSETHRTLSVFFASSSGRPIAGSSSCGCGNCSGGSCGSCSH
jgi:putative FmdB family regulatory protein